jgi:hypothetical protein
MTLYTFAPRHDSSEADAGAKGDGDGDSIRKDSTDANPNSQFEGCGERTSARDTRMERSSGAGDFFTGLDAFACGEFAGELDHKGRYM